MQYFLPYPSGPGNQPFRLNDTSTIREIRLANSKTRSEKDEFAAPDEGMTDLTITTNRIAANAGVNGYPARNAIVIEEAKQRIRYRNGVTKMPYSAMALLNDSERDVRHSDTLARNIKNATGVAKPAGAAAHHIVASSEPLAEGSRLKPFGWGIGINDADNGVYLPNSKNATLPGFPNATKHRPIHTERYYMTVYARLRLATDEPAGRLRLRSMRDEMQAGVFPYQRSGQ